MIRIEKGPRSRRMIREWSDGSKTEYWMVDGTVFEEEPGTPNVSFTTSASRASAVVDLGPDYTKSDFPELDWISLKNYVGAKTLNGRPCYVFEAPAGGQSSDRQEALKNQMAAVMKADAVKKHKIVPADAPPQPTPPSLVKTAWIDGVTRLPAAFNDGVQLKTYSFTALATTEPQPPDRFQAAIQNYENAVRTSRVNTKR
jgi:hypothetical protein